MQLYYWVVAVGGKENENYGQRTDENLRGCACNPGGSLMQVVEKMKIVNFDESLITRNSNNNNNNNNNNTTITQ